MKMRTLLITLMVLLIALVGVAFCRVNRSTAVTVLGDESSCIRWVYLCGLTAELTSQQEAANRLLLDRVGKELGVQFLAIHPKNRCAAFDNKLCWPHDTREDALKTYGEIEKILDGRAIAGYIGFSNGGFFLNQIVQYVSLSVPVISIGSAGSLRADPVPNQLYLLIGSHDVHHHAVAHRLYNRMQNTALKVTLIEYEGGHVMPETEMKNLIARFLPSESTSR